MNIGDVEMRIWNVIHLFRGSFFFVVVVQKLPFSFDSEKQGKVAMKNQWRKSIKSPKVTQPSAAPKAHLNKGHGKPLSQQPVAQQSIKTVPLSLLLLIAPENKKKIKKNEIFKKIKK